MKKWHWVLFVTLYFCLLLVGCGNSSIVGIPYWTDQSPATPADVYTAGYYRTGVEPNMVDNACYWQNTTRVNLGEANSIATAIFVDGSTVYTAGYNNTNTTQHACYWQGATLHQLETTDSSRAKDIKVVGSTVYILGYINQPGNWTVRRWTVTDNGATVVSEDICSYTGTDYAISSYLISGSDVYIAGAYYNSTTYNWDAFYRKNNDTIQICPGQWISAKGIFVNNTDVYVTGYTNDEYPTPYYWLNTNRISLPGIAQSTTVAVSGGNVYVLGGMKTVEYNWIPILWKNNKMYALRGNGASSNVIQVIGNDVYTAGFKWGSLDHDTACYWVNGSFTLLDGTAAEAIFIKQK